MTLLLKKQLKHPVPYKVRNF